ncbi:restriction endonuclease subunit S [Mycoplasma corogypsi]|uniref:restriction endonuclease subunit S n=1 Tax=Mycoplasma corogypsi TaxID=2106 RepID=UPI0038736268
MEIYKGIVENQTAYETGLEDLKLVCDGYVENLKKTTKCEKIGKFIVELNEKNEDGKITLAQGVDSNLQFIPAKRELRDKESGKIVHNGEFAFCKVVACNGTSLPIALRKGQTCFISSSYTIFKVIDENDLISEYLMLWMSREETQRKCGFNAWGSTRDVFPFEELCKLEIPYPSITVQKSIVDIYNAYTMRKEINEQWKQQIKNLCPILIKGAVEEAKRS